MIAAVTDIESRWAIEQFNDAERMEIEAPRRDHRGLRLREPGAPERQTVLVAPVATRAVQSSTRGHANVGRHRGCVVALPGEVDGRRDGCLVRRGSTGAPR
jgi:hypothetical protein